MTEQQRVLASKFQKSDVSVYMTHQMVLVVWGLMPTLKDGNQRRIVSRRGRKMGTWVGAMRGDNSLRAAATTAVQLCVC